MKQKLLAFSKIFLTTCMGLTWWFNCNLPSAVVLGEYPYPTEDEN